MKSKLEQDDEAFCTSHGMKYIPPDPPISLKEFWREQHYRNQGPRQGEHQMWTIGAERYDDDDDEQESDTTTSQSEWGMMLVFSIILVLIVVALAQG